MHVELFGGKLLSIGGSGAVYSPDGSTLAIVTQGPLFAGLVNVAYSATMVASGGTTPYTWSITAGTLPTGMSFSSAGVFSGTPTAAVLASLTIKVTDNVSAQVSNVFALNVAANSALTVRTVSGNFTNGVGTSILPRGFNLQGLEASCAQGNQPWYGVTPLYAQWASAGWYPTFIRIPLNAASFLGLNCLQINSTGTGWISTTPTNADPFGNYIAAVDASIAAAQARGMRVILDLHWSAPILTFASVAGFVMPLGQPLFMNTDTDLTFWQAIVARYGTQATPQVGIDNTGIIFELFNEPFLDQVGYSGTTLFSLMKNGGAVTTFSNNNYTTPNITQTWTALGFQTVLTAIRAAGATNVCLINQAAYSHSAQNYASYMPADPLPTAQLGIGFHAYPANAYPYTGGNNFPLTFPEANNGLSNWDVYLQAIRTANIPIILTESGGTFGPTATSLEPFATYVTSWCQTNNVGYIGWTWWPQATPTLNGPAASGSSELDTNVGGNPTTGFGVVVYNWLSSFNALTITTQSPLPTATFGSPYTFTMTASGGTAPYTWASVGVGLNVIPPGLTFNSSTGVISGTPTSAPLTPNLSIQVTDSASHTVTNNFLLTVNTQTLQLMYANGALDPTFPVATDLSSSAAINRTYSGANVYPGNTNSMQVTTNASNGFGGNWQPASLWNTIPPNGFDTSPYTYIQFDCNTPNPANMFFGSHYSRATGNDIGTSTSCTQGSVCWSITAGTWTRIKIALSSIGMLASYNFYKFAIGNNSNSTFYIDNVYWVSGSIEWSFRGEGVPAGSWSNASFNLGTGSVDYTYLPNTVINPTTGLSGNAYSINNPNQSAARFTATCSGSVMNVTAVASGTIRVGDSACWQGNLGGASTPTINSFGTGSGGTGTYNLSTSQTVATQQWASAPSQLKITCVNMTSTVINSTLKLTRSSPITTASYAYFTFGVIPTRSGYGYQVQLFDGSGVATGAPVNVGTTYCQHDFGVNNSNFTVHNVPLSAFGGIASSLGGVSIKETSSNTSNTTYFSAVGFFI